MPISVKPCGQHTAFEPQCETCRRLAELTEALRDLVSRVGGLELLGSGLALPLVRALHRARAALDKAEGPIP